jgi:hypothetical protein
MQTFRGECKILGRMRELLEQEKLLFFNNICFGGVGLCFFGVALAKISIFS